jgi:peptide chain release factor 1
MFEKLAQIEKSYDELTEQISQPEFMSDMSVYAKLMKQHRSLGEIVGKYREVRKMHEDLQGAKDLADLADDDEMREMAAIEIAEIEEKNIPSIKVIEKVGFKQIRKFDEDDNGVWELDWSSFA